MHLTRLDVGSGAGSAIGPRDLTWTYLHDRTQLSRKLRLSIVDHCNLSCNFCHNEGQGPVRRIRAESLDVNSWVRIVRSAVTAGVAEVKLTGGEPLLYGHGHSTVVDLVEALAELRTEQPFGLSLTTNGVMLPQSADALRRAGLDRVTVSLHTLKPDTFKQINTRPAPQHGVSRVIAAIRAAVNAGLRPVKVNTVLLDAVGAGNIGEIESIVETCRDLGVDQLRFYTLLDHENYADHSSWYRFWDAALLSRVGRALHRSGPLGDEYARQALAFLNKWKQSVYPKPTFVSADGSFEVSIEAMQSGRFSAIGLPDEGPYALRVSARGELRGMIEAAPVVVDLRNALAQSADAQLTSVFRDSRELLLPQG